MSLEVNLSRKLVLENTDASSSSSTQSETTLLGPIPSGSGTGILKTNSNRRRPSPQRTPSLIAEKSASATSPPPPYTSSNSVPLLSTVKPHRSVSLSVSGGASTGTIQNSIPPEPRATSAPPDRVHSVRLTRKIFNNWRSACGKTKDKTKDFIRRWKTLPENHPDFDELAGLASGMNSTAPDSTSTPMPSSTFARVKGLGKKQQSECEADSSHGEECGGAAGSSVSTGPNKPSAGWSVHIWATWVQRGPGEDDLDKKEEPVPGRDLLSDFQKVKLIHFFRHVLDMNHDDVISAEDFVALNQRIRHYIEWSSECMEFHILKEVHSGFLEFFLNQPLDECSHMFYSSPERETREAVNREEWLDVWGRLLLKARSLESLPLWLQYFPKILFQVINKSGSGTISKEELRAFYTMFLGIDFRIVNDTLDSIYNAMTDGGQWKINFGLFKLCFTNFLLGKYPHGPGQYLFGICAPASVASTFPIDYSALNTPSELLEPYDPAKEKDKNQTNRRSVIV